MTTILKTTVLNSFSSILGAGGGVAVDAHGWFLENAWLVPLIPAISFVLILFFGKKMPKNGSEIGIAAVGLAFVFACIAGVQWIGQYNGAEETYEEEHSAALEFVDEESLGGSLSVAVPDDAPALAAASGNLTSSPSTPGVEELAPGEEAELEVGLNPIHRTIDWWVNGGVDFKVGILVDGLTVMMLFVVTAISLLVHIYSTDYVDGDRRYTHYFAFLSLFTSAMLFFVLSENILQMIVGWELVGVCSFALIGHWWEDQANSDAALKAFLTNRVGDMGLLVGMIILFWAAGTWDTLTINEMANTGAIPQNLLLIASVCLMFAVMSKSGQFVLHTWLPDAMAGPTPVSALIHAATMVVAGVYMIARLYGVFFNGLTIPGSSINMMAVIGAITVVFGGLLAFVQDDIKKVLAYSTVSQLGYMVMALGVGAWTAAVFHLFTHAFFKAGLFLGAGSVSHAVHSFDMKKDMGGMRKFMPTTFKTFMVCTAALIGIFPFAGFWSKDEILVGTGGWGLFGGTGGNGAYVAMLVMGLIGAALTAAYMTRVIYLTFYGEFRGGHHDEHADDHADAHDEDHAHDDHHGLPHESGPRITIPLIILAAMAAGAGVLNLPPGFITGHHEDWQERFGHYIEPTGTGYFPEIAHGTPSYSLAILASIIGVAGIGLAYFYYFVRVKAQGGTELVAGPTSKNGLAKAGHTMLKEKYYLDHLYTDAVAGSVKGPIAQGAYLVNQNVIDGAVNTVGTTAVKVADVVYEKIDQDIVDGTVNATGRASGLFGDGLRRMQTGKVQRYATYMFAAATVIVGLLIVFI